MGSGVLGYLKNKLEELEIVEEQLEELGMAGLVKTKTSNIRFPLFGM